MRGDLLTAGASLLLVAGVMSGCSTPRHTNTLIFGTNTKVALDVSQDPTGAVGITLGYKRQEAVWMPLLANEQVANGSDLVPTKCKEDDCTKFAATTGAGGPAGSGAKDTYSVLATLSGQTSGSAGGTTATAEAKGGIAQVFATGFAARLLAMTGGAALVNTEAPPPTGAAVAAVAAANAKTIQSENTKIDRILVGITSKDGKLDEAKFKALRDKAQLSDADKKALANFKDAEKLRGYLEGNFEKAGQPLFDVVN
jgi:hypothetical protein